MLLQHSTVYAMPLFYASAVFLKKLGLNQKGVNLKWYSHKEEEVGIMESS
jgi:hypothetical protein